MCDIVTASDFEHTGLLGKVVCLLVLCITYMYQYSIIKSGLKICKKCCKKLSVIFACRVSYGPNE